MVGWTLLNQLQMLLWSDMIRGQAVPTPSAHKLLRGALDHPRNLLHECTQSDTHQRATADMGQTGDIRVGIITPTALCYFDVRLPRNSPCPLTQSSHPFRPALAQPQRACSLVSSHSYRQVHTLSQPTALKYSIAWGFPLFFNEGHHKGNPVWSHYWSLIFLIKSKM